MRLFKKQRVVFIMCVCVRAAWPWHHVVNIVLFFAWLAHSFVFCSLFSKGRCCMTRLNVKPIRPSINESFQRAG